METNRLASERHLLPSSEYNTNTSTHFTLVRSFISTILMYSYSQVTQLSCSHCALLLYFIPYGPRRVRILLVLRIDGCEFGCYNYCAAEMSAISDNKVC